MPRARTLKPSFFKNEELVGMDFWVRLLFEGLWVLADRDGRLEDRPLRIKMEVLPNDAVDVEAGLAQLAAAGLIDRYEAGGARVIQVATFGKHQSPHPKEPSSNLPDRDGVRPNDDRPAPESGEQLAGNLQASGETVSGPASPSYVSRPSQPSHDLGENAPLPPAAAGGDQPPDAPRPVDISARRVPKPDPDPPGFAAFWAAYPKHVERKAAVAAWRTLAPNREMQAEILAAVEAQKRGPDWLRDGGKYVKHPHRWLQGECWTDEVPDPPVLALAAPNGRAPTRTEQLRGELDYLTAIARGERP